LNRLNNILQSNLTYIILTIFIIIYSLINVFLIKRESIYFEGINTVTGSIKSISYNDNGTKIELDSKEDLIVFYDMYVEYKLGDKIKVEGVLEQPTENSVFNLFSYKKYLYNQKIFFIMKADKIILLKNNQNIFLKFKSKIIDISNNRKTSKYLKAFILGDTSLINDNVMKSYQKNGVSHLFAISGMHISLITLILNKIIKKNKIFICLFILFYMFLTSFSPSIMRAGIFFILLFINKKYKLNIKIINVLLFTLFVSLLINPFLITRVGFQYSFIISFFLIKCTKILKNKSKTKSLLLVSLIAFISSIPISVNNFFQINILSIIYNLIFVPLVSSILFPLSLIAFIFKPLDILLNVFINILENLSLFLSNINIGIFTFGKISLIFIIIYYFILLFITNNFKLKRNYIFLIILIFLFYNRALLNRNIEITYLDVGQGDSIYINLPYNNGSILIDTGGNSSKTYSLGKEVISKYIYSNGIRKIDYMIITHGDYDHIGEAIEVVDSIKIKNVILNCGQFNDLENNLIKVLENKNIKYYSCIKEINIGKYRLEFLNNKIYNNENDNSIVIYTNLNNYKFLFMGDAGVEVEYDLIDKYNLNNIDFLKVGHHGSKTSSSKEFIDNIKPKYSLISVGLNNKFGHPNEDVLNSLSDSKIYRTDIDGSVKVKLNKNAYVIY